MEHRCRMQVHITFIGPSSHDKMHGIGDDIVVGEHDPFGPSRRATRVEQPVEVIFANLLVRAGASGCSLLHQAFVMEHLRGRLFGLETTVHNLLDVREAFPLRRKRGEGLVNDQHPGFAVVEDKVDFWWGEAGIQGDNHASHTGAGIVEFEVAVAIEHQHRDTVAALARPDAPVRVRDNLCGTQTDSRYTRSLHRRWPGGSQLLCTAWASPCAMFICMLLSWKTYAKCLSSSLIVPSPHPCEGAFLFGRVYQGRGVSTSVREPISTT